MLRIARLTDRSGRYYMADLADELGVGEVLAGRSPQAAALGRWTGAGASGLALSGPVEPEALAAVLSGRHPGGGHALRVRPTTIVGFDLVFAAPKSVSALFGVGGQRHALAAVEAHREAVAAAVDYVARRAAGVRVGADRDRGLEPVRGLVAACFDHGVSRALDPHLHTHVVVANMAQGSDGRWRALDGRGLAAHGRAAGALYDAHLRWALHERIPAAWTVRRSGAIELAAVDPLVVGALSGRTAEIRQHVAERAGTRRDRPSHRARSVAWATTRDVKATAPERTPALLRQRWQDRCADVGWPPVELARALDDLGPPRGPSRRPTARPALDEHRFAAGLHDGTLHAGVTRRDVVTAWAGALVPGASAGDIDRCVDGLAPWQPAVGVAEPALGRRRVLASPEALRALGPRPSSPEDLDVWRSAAGTIEQGRRQGLVRGLAAPASHGDGRHDGRDDPLGMPAADLAAYLRLERAVGDARRRLGRDRDPVWRDAGREIGR